MIGVIADDLSGAAEIGAVGARRGLRSEIVLAGEPDPAAELVCVDTDSRMAEPAEAARRAAEAAAMLHGLGAGWIYKKTDSVLRGNVATEIAGALEALGLPAALLVPANPSLGRTIIGGHYLIDGQPIDRTGFAHDPGHPRWTSDALELLGCPPELPVRACEPDQRLPQRGLVLGEAATVEDLQRWAAGRPESWLMAGASGFFEALLAIHPPTAGSQPARTGDAGLVGRAEAGQLFVCGSASTATRGFVASQRSAGVPVLSLPGELAHGRTLDPADAQALAARLARSLGEHGRAVLDVGLPLLTGGTSAGDLPRQLARVAGAALSLRPVGRIFAEGGATAVALAREMGWRRLEVVAELAPGVATLRIDADSPTLLTIKPGSYRWPDSVVVRPRSSR